MERINELLERYFKGETTLAEENELKQYFANGNIAPEHKPYSALFQAFSNELEERLIISPQKIIPKHQTIKRLWIKTFAYSGIAATILIAVWIQYPQQKNENFAVVAGNRIEDAEYAQKYAEKKLDKVNQILRNSMKPMQSIETVRRSLQPMQKIRDTKEKLDKIENKIQFK
jgi:hypothetical protein